MWVRFASIYPGEGDEQYGQTVIVIGGSAGIGLETARRSRAEGADVILTGRDPEHLQHAALELGALSSAAFDATDPAWLEQFFGDAAISSVRRSPSGASSDLPTSPRSLCT